jgi:hypothetical protein
MVKTGITPNFLVLAAAMFMTVDLFWAVCLNRSSNVSKTKFVFMIAGWFFLTDVICQGSKVFNQEIFTDRMDVPDHRHNTFRIIVAL